MSAVSPEEIRAGLELYGRMADMNDQVSRHRAVCDELNKLYERKNHDYGDSFHQTFLEEGFAMPRIRLSDKFNRFKTLSKHAAAIEHLIPRATDSDAHKVLVKDQKVTDESIRDTLIDLANYAIMTVLEIDSIRAEVTSQTSFIDISEKEGENHG